MDLNQHIQHDRTHQETAINAEFQVDSVDENVDDNGQICAPENSDSSTDVFAEGHQNAFRVSLFRSVHRLNGPKIAPSCVVHGPL